MVRPQREKHVPTKGSLLRAAVIFGVLLVGAVIVGVVLFSKLRLIAGNALSAEESFQAVTGISPRYEVQASVSGWEDYTGWFRVRLSLSEVYQAAARLEAASIGPCRRVDALRIARIGFEPPPWWTAEPDSVGECWISAGARHGQLMTPATLRRVIRDAGRVPVQRDTAYRVVREFGATPDQDPPEPLDSVVDADSVFGSYDDLTPRRARLV